MFEKKEKSTAIELECPGCAEVNLIDPQRSVFCKKCTKPITGLRYKIATLSMLPFVFGAVGYGLVDWKFLAEERYPLEYEYALVNACINGDQSGLPRQSYKNKQDACICALNKTTNDISYADFRDNPRSFTIKVNSNLFGCS